MVRDVPQELNRTVDTVCAVTGHGSLQFDGIAVRHLPLEFVRLQLLPAEVDGS